MKFSDSFLDEIRARLPVSQVVSRRVGLKRAGREWKGLSPFNQEKTPSFTVNDQKGFYHCFSSGKHGDIFGFVMDTEGLSFPEAVEKLAGEAGLSLPKPDPQFERAARERLSLLDALEAAAKFFEEQLRGQEGRGALAYAEQRGLSPATLKEFRIGFAPNGKDVLKGALGKLRIHRGPVSRSRSLDQAGRRPRSLRPLSQPAHHPDPRSPRPRHCLRCPCARSRCRAEISELARDEALRQGLDCLQFRPRARPGLRQRRADRRRRLYGCRSPCIRPVSRTLSPRSAPPSPSGKWSSSGISRLSPSSASTATVPAMPLRPAPSIACCRLCARATPFASPFCLKAQTRMTSFATKGRPR